MKKLAIALICAGSSLFAQEMTSINVRSEITSAIVYLDGAEVLRNKTVELRQGKNEIVFEGLSPKLNDKTIQIYTPKGIEILSITSKINYLTLDDKHPKIKMLEDSVELITHKINSLNDERSAYDLERELLIANKSIGGQDKGVAIAELREAADFYRNRLLEINRKNTSIMQQLQKYNKEMNKLNLQLQEVNSQNSIQRAEIAVLLSSASAVKAPLELRYLVNEVGWIPAYDIKATEISEPIQLIYRAKVYNNSNIDWKNVKLTLSSADPTLSASKPTMSPWYLNYRQGQLLQQNAYSQQNVGGNLRQAAQALPPSRASAFESELGDRNQSALNTFQKGGLTFTNIAISDINAEFEIAERYSIPSDAKPYFIRIKEYKLNAVYKHYAVPKQSCDVFLLARITGWEDLDILEGTANIYLNGTFTGQSFINTREVNDTLDLSLGRDNKVVVQRKKELELSSTKSIGSNKKETFAYKIVVKNNHKVPVNIEVIDQLPVPQDSDIEVDKLELSGGVHNELNGEVNWKYSLNPAKSRTINLSFAIKYPKNRPINTRIAKYRSVRYF